MILAIALLLILATGCFLIPSDSSVPSVVGLAFSFIAIVLIFLS